MSGGTSNAVDVEGESFGLWDEECEQCENLSMRPFCEIELSDVEETRIWGRWMARPR